MPSMDDLQKRVPQADAREVREKLDRARTVFEIDANVAESDLG
jgi:hypothetical protein